MLVTQRRQRLPDARPLQPDARVHALADLDQGDPGHWLFPDQPFGLPCRDRGEQLEILPVRQGDVCLIPIALAAGGTEEPEPTDPRGLVLAEGESSGHFHAIFGRGAKLFRFRYANGAHAKLVARLTHEGELRTVGGGAAGADRHTAIPLRPGTY